MTALAAFQQAFARALAAPRMPGHAIHANNAAVALATALADNFPVTQRLMGQEAFAGWASRYVRECPPETPCLGEYGDRFPGFLAEAGELADHRWLGDVARLEWLWLEALFAADADPAAPGDTALEWHPALRVAAFESPAVSLWQAHQGADAPDLSGIDWHGEVALVGRSAGQVMIAHLTPPLAQALAAVAQRAQVPAALRDALDYLIINECLVPASRGDVGEHMQ